MGQPAPRGHCSDKSAPPEIVAVTQAFSRGRDAPILFSNGSMGGRSVVSDFDAFGRLRSLRAHVALDGVSWLWSGSVEIAVGRRPHATKSAPSSTPSLGRRSRSGARFGFLSVGAARLCRFELGAVSQHSMHDDCEPASERDPRFSHGGTLCYCKRPILQLQRSFEAS